MFKFSLNHIRKELREGRTSTQLRNKIKVQKFSNFIRTKYTFSPFSAENTCSGLHLGPFLNVKGNQLNQGQIQDLKLEEASVVGREQSSSGS